MSNTLAYYRNLYRKSLIGLARSFGLTKKYWKWIKWTGERVGPPPGNEKHTFKKTLLVSTIQNFCIWHWHKIS